MLCLILFLFISLIASKLGFFLAAISIGSFAVLVAIIFIISFSFFAFADLFYASGKTNVNNGLGGSTIVGAGVKFSDIWRF